MNARDPMAGSSSPDSSSESWAWTVRSGYNAIAERYLDYSRGIEGAPTRRYLDRFMGGIPEGSRVLDLGCGAGIPVARALSNRFSLTGVDVSDRQLRLARTNVPSASLIQGDMLELRFTSEAFGGVVALYSLSHLPRETHPALFGRIADWLMPGGLLLASMGATDSPDRSDEWLGVPMFYSSWNAETNREMLGVAGFQMVFDEIVTLSAPDGSRGESLWVLARKP